MFLLKFILFCNVILLSHNKPTSLPWPQSSGLGESLLDDHCIPPVLLKGHFLDLAQIDYSSEPEMLCEVLVTHFRNVE